MNDSNEIVKLALRALEYKKAEHIRIIHIREGS